MGELRTPSASPGGRRVLVSTVGLAALVASGISPGAAGARSLDDLESPSGYVVDLVGVLTPIEKDQLESICTELERANATELVIVVLESTEGRPIKECAQTLFEKWGIGKAEFDNGVLVLVAVRDAEWRVHTGYGVEGILPDTLAWRIMEDEALQEFKAGRYGQGLINVAQRMKAQLETETYDPSSVVYSRRGYQGRGPAYIYGLALRLGLGVIVLYVLIMISLYMRSARARKGNETTKDEIG